MLKYVCLCHIIERVKWYLFYHLFSILLFSTCLISYYDLLGKVTLTFEFQVFCSYRIGVLVHHMDLLLALQRIQQCSTNEIEFLGIAAQTCRTVYCKWRIYCLIVIFPGMILQCDFRWEKFLHWLLNVFSFCQVLVRNVPHSSGRSTSDSVDQFFHKNHPEHYLSHQVIILLYKNIFKENWAWFIARPYYQGTFYLAGVCSLISFLVFRLYTMPTSLLN